jgi:hypothetical protein
MAEGQPQTRWSPRTRAHASSIRVRAQLNDYFPARGLDLFYDGLLAGGAKRRICTVEASAAFAPRRISMSRTGMAYQSRGCCDSASGLRPHLL